MAIDNFDNPTPEQEASIEDLAEKRGISIEMAKRAFFGLRTESPSTSNRLPGKPIARGPNRRGGRSYPEKSGLDVSLEIAKQAPIPEGAGEKGPAYEAYKKTREDL